MYRVISISCAKFYDIVFSVDVLHRKPERSESQALRFAIENVTKFLDVNVFFFFSVKTHICSLLSYSTENHKFAFPKSLSRCVPGMVRHTTAYKIYRNIFRFYHQDSKGVILRLAGSTIDTSIIFQNLVCTRFRERAITIYAHFNRNFSRNHE